MRNQRVSVIVGGQFGSEAKGQLAGWLVRQGHDFDAVISNSGSQAGHTFQDGNQKLVLRHLPIAGVLLPNSKIILSPACIIDPDVLLAEIEQHPDINYRLFIHENAAWNYGKKDMEYEQHLLSDIGSTCKGNGAALCGKIMRDPNRIIKGCEPLHKYLINHEKYIKLITYDYRHVLVEGAQGYSLSLDAGFYPHTTSRNCWVGQALADAWLHPSSLFDTYMVCRYLPIRVGGPSGPCYDDQTETTWESLGLKPEYTTVTKRERRVFDFSFEQLRQAIVVNQPSIIAFSHMDYADVMQNSFRGDQFLRHIRHMISSYLHYYPDFIIGTGPDLKDWKKYP